MLAADPADIRERIDGVGGSGADGGDHQKGGEPGRAVRFDPAGERVRAQGQGCIHVDQTQVCGADAGDFNPLLNGRMGLGGGIGGQAAVAAALVAGKPRRSFAGGQKGAQSGAGGGVLDDTAALACRTERLGQVEDLRHPVEHMSLQFGAGGTGGPQHALHAQPGRNQITQDGRAGRVRGKVSKEIRRLPVGDPGQDYILKVFEDGVEGFAVLGRMGGKRRSDVSRLSPGKHGQRLHAFVVVGHPVDRGMPQSSEIGKAQMIRFILRHVGFPLRTTHCGSDRRYPGCRGGDPQNARMTPGRIPQVSPEKTCRPAPSGAARSDKCGRRSEATPETGRRRR